MQIHRSLTAAALALGLALATVAHADCGTAGQYCNGDPNHNAAQQLSHAAEGIRQAAEAFDGSRS